MCRGVVKFFNDQKGFGFIYRMDPNTGKLDMDKADIFVHFSHIDSPGYRTLYDSDIVTFTWIDTPKGLQAEKVVRTGDQYEGADFYF
ncbi:hypothetical protein GF345_00755 [Candidatus Woesearchaeota archaeon]|nr:hypothetical protein [Candidatus Woesearchaeota archaeon]